MKKIFKYELKRLIFNKIFFALLMTTILYSYQILKKDIIVGIAYTAPFSGWSYGMYLARVLPLLLITLIFFITFLYSKEEKQVKQLTFATPVNPLKYGFIKGLTIVVGYIIISLFVIVISLLFYGVIFHFYKFTDFIIPSLITLIPALFFIFGAGLLIGSIHPNMLYVLIVLVLLIGFLPLPTPVDLYGIQTFSTYPLTLPVGPDGEPPFILPTSFLLGKVFFIVIGAAMIFFGIKGYANNHEKI